MDNIGMLAKVRVHVRILVLVEKHVDRVAGLVVCGRMVIDRLGGRTQSFV